MHRKVRGVFMVATALAAAGSILWMQSKYEAADQRNALEIVKDYHPSGGTTIPAVIAARHPNKMVSWSTAVENTCYQHIRVHAVVTEDGTRDPVLYGFVVDINGPAIHPANDNGKDVLAAVASPLPASVASPSEESTASGSTAVPAGSARAMGSASAVPEASVSSAP